MKIFPARRRLFVAAASVLVVTTGAVTLDPTASLAYVTAPCDPAGVTPTDTALASSVGPQLHAGLQTTITGYRVSCARMIVAAVRAAGLGQDAAVIAVTTTIVESGLQNVATQVDHDSLGLFQQRALWGPAASRLDPNWATTAFLSKLGRAYPDGAWARVPVGVACQRVQVSAYPDRYQGQAADAAALVAALWVGPADTSLVAGDVDGDGRPELIGRRPDGTLWLYPNAGGRDAPYPAGVQIGTGWQQFLWLQAGDVNDDHRADLLAARPDGTLWLYLATGPDTAPYVAGSQIGVGWQVFTAVTLADVSADGHPDLLAERPDGTLWSYLGTGDPAAPFQLGVLVGTGVQIYDRLLAGNVDGDGGADLLGTRPDGTLWLYRASGDPAAPFQPGVQIGAGWQEYQRLLLTPVTADLRADLIAATPAGTLLLYPNQHGTGAPYTVSAPIGAGWADFL